MLYERIVDPRLLVRRLTVIADDVATANELAAGKRYEQLDLFSQIDSSAEEGDDGHVGISNSDVRREHADCIAGGQEEIRPQCRHQGDGHGGRRHRPGPQSADRRPSCMSVLSVLRYRA